MTMTTIYQTKNYRVSKKTFNTEQWIVQSDVFGRFEIARNIRCECICKSEDDAVKMADILQSLEDQIAA